MKVSMDPSVLHIVYIYIYIFIIIFIIALHILRVLYTYTNALILFSRRI
jgi:hypothetical protein